MTEDRKANPPVPLEPFRLKLLGGTFVVREVFAGGGSDVNDMVRVIRATPSERWFVMLAEGGADGEDVLAVIDDDFEFQSVAVGTMESD